MERLRSWLRFSADEIKMTLVLSEGSSDKGMVLISTSFEVTGLEHLQKFAPYRHRTLSLLPLQLPRNILLCVQVSVLGGDKAALYGR